MNGGPLRLSERPDWHAATRELVAGFAALDAPEERVRLMDKLCERLGGSLYPAFLQILCIVERDGDERVRLLVIDTLMHALATGRLPVGRVPAWGAPRALGATAFEQGRSLGPIEYLCAWYAQPSELPPLDAGAFGEFASGLLRLVSGSRSARALYRAKLLEAAEDPSSGALARETRAALAALADEWQRTDEPDVLVAVCLEALRAAGEERLGRIETNPFF